jgi:RimJ/RimL family protein N-acetyltransferase
MSVVRLRPAGYDDAPVLFDWANEKEVRRNRLSGSDPLGWLEHCEWIQRRIDKLEPEKVFVAVDSEGCPVGVGRILMRPDDNDGLIGVLVDAGARRSGIGYQIVKLLVSKIKKAGRVPVAKVLNSNVSSQRLFAGCGFQYTGGSIGWREYRLEA